MFYPLCCFVRCRHRRHTIANIKALTITTLTILQILAVFLALVVSVARDAISSHSIFFSRAPPSPFMPFFTRTRSRKQA